jgi:hypothetical protein
MSVPVSFKREGGGGGGGGGGGRPPRPPPPPPLGTHDEVASLPATTQEETSADESDTGA